MFFEVAAFGLSEQGIQRYVYAVSSTFPQLLTYVFANAYNIADGTVLILYTHVDNASVVWDSLKLGMHL